MKFPQILRNLRKSRGYTQDELAHKLGISKSAVSMYENGKREPGLEGFENIADFFNVDISILTGNTTERAFRKPSIYEESQQFIEAYEKLKKSNDPRDRAAVAAVNQLLGLTEQGNDETR